MAAFVLQMWSRYWLINVSVVWDTIEFKDNKFYNCYLQQIHEGQYICKVDNGVGPGDKATVTLQVRSGKFHV